MPDQLADDIIALAVRSAPSNAEALTAILKAVAGFIAMYAQPGSSAAVLAIAIDALTAARTVALELDAAVRATEPS